MNALIPAPTNSTHALLLTDVVDSTKLAERLGDAAAADLSAAHDRAARDLLRTWRGREIDKTDGMLMLFDAADDALGFAVAYHHALAALPVPLRARAGLHVGTVILRRNPPEDVARGAKPLEVEGIAKPLAARVMSLAQGGQTLLTAEACAALGSSAFRVQSHGFWRIKGLAEPVELFEAGDEHAPFTPPPDSAKVYRVLRSGELWLPLREVAHGLPAERDAFVGRGRALADLARRFEQGARLVSVLGVGGTGKTRLATRFGWTWLGDFPGGAWFCDLAAARGPEGIVQAVAHALGVPLDTQDPVQQLGHAIAGRGACLMILDNFEQVARHAEETLGRWLDRAAEARFLVTSRELLGLPGEEALALAPLDADEASRLFVQRAGAARNGDADAAVADDAEAIAQLVKLLDGLPLAIELAAARVRVMPPRTLLARMDRRFQLLAASGGRRDRQATLRAAFDWSWDLLSQAERAALAQLSVFEGGFALEAAEGVLDLSAQARAPWPVDALQSLVDKSFVRPLGAGRFDLLSSVQDYAAEHLRTPGRFDGSGAQAEGDAHARHASWFAQRAAQHTDGSLGADLENLRAACRRAVQRGDCATAAAALEGAWSVLAQRGPFGVGVELAQAVAAMPGLDAAAGARTAWVAGQALNAAGQVDESQARLQSALALAREAALPAVEARALIGLGDAALNESQWERAKVLHAQALALARTSGEAADVCAALNGLGSACIDLGLSSEAAGHYAAALHAARAAGDKRWEGLLLGNLGTLHFSAGALDESIRHTTDALAIAREFGDRKAEGNMLCNLAALHQMRGRLVDSQQASAQALQVARAIGHVRLECIVQCNLGLVCVDLQDWPAAEAHFAGAVALARQTKDPRYEGLFLAYLGQAQAHLGRLGDARISLGAGEALLRQLSERFSLGLLQCRRAEVEALGGDLRAAAGALAEARALAVELGSAPDSEFGVSLERARGFVDADQR